MANWVEQDCGHATPCWVWQGAKVSKGYGWRRRDGKHVYAHVAEWTDRHGPVPDGLELDHLCRNTACCNPDHLEPVTHAENMRRSARCVLTAESVTELRRLLRSGHSPREVARRLGIGRHVVYQVKNGRSWVGVGE